MDVLTPIVTGALLAVFTAILGVLGKSQFDSLRSEIAALRHDVAEVRSEMAIMRSDLTHVALAVGARPQTG
ncbi:MAG TPA: hypothetical protein VFA34_16380 [Actinomycetota bacterium]|jgi:hypothetical protein|nr:hypothetical protein [Actinomycetota bacterium]